MTNRSLSCPHELTFYWDERRTINNTHNNKPITLHARGDSCYGEKSRAGQREPGLQWTGEGAAAVLKMVVRMGLMEKGRLEQRLVGGEDV